MGLKRLLVNAISLMLIASSSFADTNLMGDYIIVIDNPVSEALDPSFNLNKNIQEPARNFLPDNLSPVENNNPNQDLRQRIISGYNLPEVKSPYTQNHEAWYAARPDYVQRMIGRSQRYLYHIVTEVEKRGMPSEIALLPMVESAFNPQAYSRSKAAGIWQFMPETGKNFGLKQDWWRDNRRDITAATDAALNYLQKLHVMFGTWDLALAAYNAGEGTVQRAIDRNRRKGLPTDYASLQLPNETKNYVPKLQAIKNIMTKPENYGLSIDYIPNKPYFKKVNAPDKIDAKVAAELAEISLEEFNLLNPEYNRPVLNAGGSVHEILLPVDAADTFQTNLANYDKPLVNWQTYHAKRGERVDKIAKKFGIDVASLREANDINSRTGVGNQPLLVPDSGKLTIDKAQTSNPVDSSLPKSENSLITHIVKAKETLFSIAKQYGVSVEQIMQSNQLSSQEIQVGQSLTIAQNTLESLNQNASDLYDVNKETKSKQKRQKKAH
ncbi:MAG: LysM peptidoglycan-binding domain-containing protein [Candidatus Methylopumilus sp.]|nr:LysM peptidoglycan-binding domain-containing protein [Candidatus Methylopumilus sp.]